MPITSNLLLENNLLSRRFYSPTNLLFKLCALKQIIFIQTESCRFTPELRLNVETSELY